MSAHVPTQNECLRNLGRIVCAGMEERTGRPWRVATYGPDYEAREAANERTGEGESGSAR